MRFSQFGSVVLATASALTLAFPGSVSAREPLDVDDGEAWTHPHVELRVPAVLGGIGRTSAIAFAQDALDVGFSFDTEGSAEALSVYIFRNTNAGVPVWFEQASWAIENRDIYGSPEPIAPPTPFVPPGQTAASGLKSIYRASAEVAYRSTGVALFAVDGWYVKLRATSTTREPEELDSWIMSVIGELDLPEFANATEVAPVQPCSVPLEFRGKAKDAKKDGAASLLGGLLGMVTNAPEFREQAAVDGSAVWCSDHSIGRNQRMYRADESVVSYLIALGDNGNSILVGPDAAASLMAGAEDRPGERYAIKLVTAGQNTSYVAQDRLPSPQRVVEILNANRQTMSVPTWGEENTIEVNSDEF